MLKIFPDKSETEFRPKRAAHHLDASPQPTICIITHTPTSIVQRNVPLTLLNGGEQIKHFTIK